MSVPVEVCCFWKRADAGPTHANFILAGAVLYASIDNCQSTSVVFGNFPDRIPTVSMNSRP